METENYENLQTELTEYNSELELRESPLGFIFCSAGLSLSRARPSSMLERFFLFIAVEFGDLSVK